MPPIDSKTPAVELDEKEINQWLLVWWAWQHVFFFFDL